jgi:pimeloyl-ACP methyl ester carboxylesterase
MEAAGSDRAAVFGFLEGGPMAMLFAASHPDRVRGLVLYATFARLAWAPDYSWAMTAERRAELLAPKLERWGTGELAGDLDPAFDAWAGRIEWLAVSPGGVPELVELIGDMDVRHVLPTIRVPTLVLHRRDDSFLRVEHSRYIAHHIPGARYVELEGSDNLLSVGDTDSVLGEIEEFLTGARVEREADRLLATVLFTDIVGSTAQAAELGDAAWRLRRSVTTSWCATCWRATAAAR